jgi:hypothetical protein
MKADAQVRQPKAISTRNIHKDKSRTCHTIIASFAPLRSKKKVNAVPVHPTESRGSGGIAPRILSISGLDEG